MNISKFLKTSVPYIISGIIGGIFTIAFFPVQKNIEQYYWNKQNRILTNQRKVEKRLDIFDALTQEFVQYRWCSIRTGVMNQTEIFEEEPFKCYQNTSAKILGLAIQVKYYYDELVISKFDEFSFIIQKYENDIDKGVFDENGSLKDITDKMTEILQIMQERMLAGLD